MTLAVHDLTGYHCTVYLGNFFDTLDKFVSDEWSSQTGKIAPLATKQESGSAAAATCLQTVLFQI